jgi:TBCC domain-containing protein 1
VCSQVAPFNTYYAQLGQHLTQSGINPNENKWDQPFVLGMVDPHDALSHPAGVSDAQSESATCLDPDLFTNFLVQDIFVSNEFTLKYYSSSLCFIPIRNKILFF